MRFRVGARTDVGRVREGNEDAFMAHGPLFAVADGMGGHQGGEVASRLALETLRSAADGEPPLSEAVREANRAVFLKAGEDPSLAGMGTTLTAVLADGDVLRLAHVGDSRAYLLRDGELQRITKDHTVVERLVEEGKLTQHEAGIHPQRSILTRAIGVEEDVTIDEGSIEVRSGDRLLLCSDGLTGMVDEDRIQGILTERPDPQAAADALVDAANLAGGQDNITAVVLDAVQEAAAPSRAGGATAPSEPVAAGATPPAPAPPAVVTEPRGAEGFASGRPRRRWRRALVWLVVVLAVAAAALFAVKRFFIDRQWFVGEAAGRVALYRGIPAEPLGLDLATLAETTEITADQVNAFPQYRDLEDGITAAGEEEARAIIEQMRRDVAAAQAEQIQP